MGCSCGADHISDQGVFLRVDTAEEAAGIVDSGSRDCRGGWWWSLLVG